MPFGSDAAYTDTDMATVAANVMSTGDARMMEHPSASMGLVHANTDDL